MNNAPVPQAKPLLIVISGPSGVGKDSILAKMKQQEHPRHYVVTVTTRPQRHAEVDGVDYCFVSKARFKQMLDNNEFLEWANVYDNLYGVPKRQVQQALAKGLDVIVKVDVQGAATIKSILPDAVFIFLAPLSLEELEERLRRRNTESAIDMKLRIATAREEMQRLPMFDYVVVNQPNQMALAVAQIEAIITAEKCRVQQRLVRL